VLPAGLPDIYMAFTLDAQTGKVWDKMTFNELKASAVNNRNVVWTGENVTRNSALVLGPYQGLRLSGTLNRDEIEYGTAAFGAPLNGGNFTGSIVLASDGVAAAGGGTLTDACEPITTNVAGKIALVDRGVCTFAVKAKNAQNAGAAGVMIANTLGRGAFGMSGTDASITIPVAGISNADGDAIKAALPGVQTSFFVDASRRAGTTSGFVRLYAPPAVETGSSGSHFDPSAFPDLLMEPFITPDLKSARNTDLTPWLMKDIGWQLETLKVGNCDSGVTTVLANGELLHARVSACAAAAKNKGAFVSCMANSTGSLVSANLLTSAQKDAVMTCAARGTP
jgi:hypothetical protein